MPTKTAAIRSKLRCEDSGPDVVEDRDAAASEVIEATEAREDRGGTDPAGVHATGIGTSTEAGRVAATATTEEGLGTAHSPVEALAETATVTRVKAAGAGSATRAKALNRQGRPRCGPSLLYQDAKEVSDVNH